MDNVEIRFSGSGGQGQGQGKDKRNQMTVVHDGFLCGSMTSAGAAGTLVVRPSAVVSSFLFVYRRLPVVRWVGQRLK